MDGLRFDSDVPERQGIAGVRQVVRELLLRLEHDHPPRASPVREPIDVGALVRTDVAHRVAAADVAPERDQLGHLIAVACAVRTPEESSLHRSMSPCAASRIVSNAPRDSPPWVSLFVLKAAITAALVAGLKYMNDRKPAWLPVWPMIVAPPRCVMKNESPTESPGA